MSIKTAIALRFSSGFSIETFQLLDLLFNAFKRKGQPGSVVLQEYQSRSPHFHEKKGDEHIKRMIAQSLGGFFLFERYLPRSVKRELKQVYHDLDLELMYPAVYPPLQDLPLAQERDFVDQYKLSGDVDSQEIVFADEEAV